MKEALFKWGALSRKQRMILQWWMPNSPYADYDGIIADGAIRSGKTVSMGFSYVIWAMETFNNQNFAICGKTIGSVRRNVVNGLKRQLKARKYTVEDKRSENLLIISKGNKTNMFYLFGGKDESSQDLIQGITLAGAFFDEVALMPESFVNQATARCSVSGSKFWFNCNPGSPLHWFYVNWIKRCKERKLVYLHFTMDDNLTLTEKVKERYKSQYVGVFFQRYIKGLWVAAEGLIYDMFDAKRHTTSDEVETEGDWLVSSDFGMQNATVFILWRKIKGSNRWYAPRVYRYSGREEKRQKTVAELVDGLETILPRNNGEIIKPKEIIVDPSASALIVELRKRGYTVRKAKNDVLDGIADVSSMLNEDRLLFNVNGCKSTIEEFGTYQWDSKKAMKGEDAPVKENDHDMDAVRYFVRTKGLVRFENKYNDTSTENLLLI